MAALLVSLRWRQLGHQLGRSPWIIVSLIVAGIAAISMLGGLGSLLLTLRVLAPGAAVHAGVLVGSVIVLGWWIGSILIGVDDLLAPERFALLPVSARSLLPGLLLAGVLGIGGIGSSLALLILLAGWSVSVPALLSAIVLAPVALATCVLGARVVGGALARSLARRRSRDVVVIVGVLLISCSGVLLNLVLSLLGRVDTETDLLGGIADVLAWTPVGAAFGVPAAIAEGAWLVAAARLVIALATLCLLWLAAAALLDARLVAPIQGAGGGAVRSGALVDRMFPATPTGAIAARVLRLRRRDPRHVLNVVMLVVLPAIFIGLQFMNGMQGGVSFGSGVVLLPAITALLVGTIVQMDLAYDHDALALHVQAGVRGADDRAGRLLGIGAVAVPVIVVLCALTCLLVGDWSLLPASIGAALGLSLIAAGVGALIGPYLPGRAPAPEANPLGRGSSGGLQSMLAMLIIVPVVLIVGAPALGFAIAALWMPMLGWASLVCALVIGGLSVWVGVRWGGKALDRRWPEVIAAVTSEA